MAELNQEETSSIKIQIHLNDFIVNYIPRNKHIEFDFDKKTHLSLFCFSKSIVSLTGVECNLNQEEMSFSTRGIHNYSKEKDNFYKIFGDREQILPLINNKIDDQNFENLNSDQKTELFFALGKAYEDLKDFENSFLFLKKANSIKKNNLDPKLENTKKLFDNIIKLFDSIDISVPKSINSKKNILKIKHRNTYLKIKILLMN